MTVRLTDPEEDVTSGGDGPDEEAVEDDAVEEAVEDDAVEEAVAGDVAEETSEDGSAADDLAEELEAMALWENHLWDATERWHEGVERSGEEYRQGYAEAMGVEPEDVPDEAVERWKEGVAETGPAEFAASIAGEGADWLLGLYESTTGEEPSERLEQVAREIERAALDRAGEDPSDEEVVEAVRAEVRRRADEGRGEA